MNRCTMMLFSQAHGGHGASGAHAPPLHAAESPGGLSSKPQSPDAAAAHLAQRALSNLCPALCQGGTLDVLVQGRWQRVAALHVDAQLTELLRAHPQQPPHAPAGNELARFLAAGTPTRRTPPRGGEAALSPGFWQQLLGRHAADPRCHNDVAALPLFSHSGRLVAVATLLGAPANDCTPESRDRGLSQAQGQLTVTLAAMEPHLLAGALARSERRANLQVHKAQLTRAARQRFAHSGTVPKIMHALGRVLLEQNTAVCAATVSFTGHRDHDRCLALCHQDSNTEQRLRARFGQWAPAKRQDIYPALVAEAALGPSQVLQALTVRDVPCGTVRLWCDPRAATDPLDDDLLRELMELACDAVDKLWLQDEVAQGATMRENFLSVASHELRTPLTALNLQLESIARLLRRHPDATLCATLKDKMARAFKQTGRLTQLIDNLLDVVALRSGALQVATTLVRVQSFLTALLERWAQEAHRAGCTLTVHCPEHITGMWDSYRMSQVLDHLMANAIKYGAGRPIHVTVQSTQDAVVITLKDSGIGVPPHVAERIFGAFERAVSPREFGGLGLGLYLSRSIVEAHGGTMAVGEDGTAGAEFFVSLPKALVA